MAHQALEIGRGTGEIAPLIGGEGAFQQGGFHDVVGKPRLFGPAVGGEGLGEFPLAVEQIALEDECDGSRGTRLGRVGQLPD